MQKVGWIGAGKMGEAMVERLIAAGIAVDVWNRTPEKCDALVAAGAKLAASPKSAAENEVVFSIVLDDKALASLHDSETGVLAGSAKVWVDCSSVSPEAAKKAAEAAANKGVIFINAPVSGNPTVVRNGKLIFAVSGARAGIDKATPYFEAIGRAVHIVGDGQQASVVKIATNALLGVLMETLSEVTVLAQSAGVKRSALLSFINDSAVGSPFSNYKSPALVNLDMTPTFTNEASTKDLSLALALADQGGVSMPLVSEARKRYAKLTESGVGAGLDIAATILQVALESGLELEAEESK